MCVVARVVYPPLLHVLQKIGNAPVIPCIADLTTMAVISAFSDVENALIAVKKLDEQEIFFTEAVDHAQNAYNISVVQYKHCLVDYTTVLQTKATLLNNRNTLILTRLNRLVALTGFYKALGGSFEEIHKYN